MNALCDEIASKLATWNLGMSEDIDRSEILIKRIADTLGVDVLDFADLRNMPPAAREAIQLLRSFERIADHSARLACLEYIDSIANQEQSVVNGVKSRHRRGS